MAAAQFTGPVLPGLALAGLALAGCAPLVTVPAAPEASDPRCAVVLQRSPEVLLGLERRTTTSQASRAWGAPEPVVLRCGVTPPGPSTERCIRVEDAAGGSVDWLALQAEDAWLFVTYGRRPAVEVVVPVSALGDDGQPTAPLVDLSYAVSATDVERSCL